MKEQPEYAVSIASERDLPSFEYMSMGFDLESRTLDLGDIDKEEATRFIRGLRILMNDCDDPITVLINSGGGDWTAALAIYDAIVDAETLIVCEVLGQCMSAAVVVAQACDRRLIHPNAAVMVHNGTHAVEAESPSFASWGKYAKRECDRMYKLIANRSGHAPGYWRRKCAAGDYIVNAQQAVQVGLFDAIIGED